jgi:hypothetical protein
MTLQEQIQNEVNEQLKPLFDTMVELKGQKPNDKDHPGDDDKHDDDKPDEVSDAVKAYLGIDKGNDLDGVSPSVATYVRQNQGKETNPYAGKDI